MSTHVELLITNLKRSTKPETLLFAFPSQGMIEIRNNSNGTGEATYADLEDAKYAVEKMDGQVIDGRKIGVRIEMDQLED